MAQVRPQYHFRQTPHGIDAWDVRRLIDRARELPVNKIDPRSLAELHENHWYWHAGAEPTPLSIVEHAQLIDACDLDFPIILDASGRVMDGMHRICKALKEDLATIDAVQFSEDPEPDYTDCDPQSLPYD